MNRSIATMLLGISLAVCVYATAAHQAIAAGRETRRPLSLVVMDPLAAPLSCPCVEGYAQRKYEVLASYLEGSLGRKVQLTFAESLSKALAGGADGHVDVIIGKDSVVRADARQAKITVTPAARLTGKDGSTTQTGLFVVPAADPAQTIADLTGYRTFFGTAECDEKHRAALDALRATGVPLPDKLETTTACSEGACKILELGPAVRGAAVISSYAQPLLEGCGTVEKGALRCVGETKPVPFITAFVSSSVPADLRERISEALLLVGSEPEICAQLETLFGFVPVALSADEGVKKK